MNSLDELFKNKLEDHSMAPSSASWSKVETNLSKKNKTFVWVRIAAGLLLMSVGGFTTYQQLLNHDSETQLASIVTTTTVAPENIKTPKPAKVETTGNTAQTLAVELKQRPVEAREQLVAVEPDTRIVEIIEEKVVAEAESTQTVIVQMTLPEVKVRQAVAATEKPLVIEYTLEPIEEEPAVAKTNFQKVVDFAVDAKNGEKTFSGLRQAKDDLLAFNFRKDRSKKQ